MSNRLYLRFIDSTYQLLSWITVDNNGLSDEPTQGTPEEIAKIAAGRQITLLAPAADILLIQPSLPTQNRQRLLQAAPFALENQIASDIDLQHFTIGRQNDDSSVPVAIVSKQKIESWLNQLEAAGIRPQAIYPETLCLPCKESEWTLLVDEERALLRNGQFSGLTLDFENVSQTLERLLVQSDEMQPKCLNLLCTSQQVEDQLKEPLSKLVDELVTRLTDRDPLPLLAENCIPTANLNLLHGPYQQNSHSQIIWRSWYPTFAVALLLVILSFASGLHELNRLEKQHLALSLQIEQLFKKSLPESKKMVNPKAQMSQKLQALQSSAGSSSGFLKLVNLTGKATNAQSQSTIDGLNFRQGELNVQLTIKDLQMLELLKKRLEKSQLTVNIRSANAQKGSVKAHLQIGEAAQ